MLKKIKVEEIENSENDFYYYGKYIQTFPCPEEVFDLKAWTTNGVPLSIDYIEKLDTIRDFKINFGKVLEFEEEFEVNESHTDIGWYKEGDNYYDNEFFQPTFIYEFKIILPIDSYLEKYDVGFLNNNLKKQKLIHHSGKTNEGCDYIYYKIEKPPYKEILRLNFSFKNKNNDESNILDKLRTSQEVYNLINKDQNLQFKIKQVRGRIVIVPIIN